MYPTITAIALIQAQHCRLASYVSKSLIAFSTSIKSEPKS